jgi:hypothetical protein
MYKLSLRPLTLSLLAGTCLAGQAAALEASGNAVRVDPAVNARGASGARLLEVEGAVFMGDELVAGPNGLAQIRFVDDTKLVVGPNSRLKIDTFVFNPNNTAQKVTISALKGSFRFISGNSPHDAYHIRTPTMSIGVRGTVVDINARGPDSSAVFLAGSGTLCDVNRRCIDVTDDCTLYVFPRGGNYETPTGQAREQRMEVFFPFTQSQARLDPEFRTDISSCAVANRLLGPPPENFKSRTTPGYGDP